MSIKEFIETAGAESIFDGNLPIPFIDNIAITDDTITIGTSIYINIPAHDYQADGGSEFLSTFEDVQVCIQPLFDRDSDVDSCGVEISNKYYDLPKDAWTRVTKKGMSPIKYWNGRSTISIITRFAFEPDTADLTTLIDEIENGNDLLFIDYTLPNGALAGFDDIDEYVDSISKDVYGDSDTELYAANMRPTLIGLIQQAISANDKDVVEQVFGYTSYHVGGDPVSIEGLIPNMQIIKCELKGFPSQIENIYPTYTITDVLENTDGSAIVKLSDSKTVSDSRLSKNLYDRSSTMGIKNMGFVAYTIANHDGSESTMSGKILTAAKTKNSSIKYWESAISKTNHIMLINNDQVTLVPTVIYRDSNDKVYHKAMRSIDGEFYSLDSLSPDTLLSSMLALQELKEAPESTNTAFQYLIAQAAEDPGNAIPLMNKFRRAFPDKSTVTPAGLFYNKFATILYSANQNLKSGTKLVKNLVNNPIVKDYRTDPGGTIAGTHVGDDYKDPYYEIFSFENALWSRYTEVTGKDSAADGISENRLSVDDLDASVSLTEQEAGAVNFAARVSTGFDWNYNFIDHGFLFFNYERALKTTSYASRYLNIRLYEKYFGQKVFNSLFTMRRVLLGAYWGDPGALATREEGGGSSDRYHAGTMSAYITAGSTEQVTRFSNVMEQTYSTGEFDYAINTRKFDAVVENDMTLATAENGYVTGDNLDTKIGNEFGGADAMINSKEYSYIALRAFSPVMTQDNLSPLEVDKTFLQQLPTNYRVACYEVQKCDHWDPSADYGVSDTLSIKDGVSKEIEENNSGGSFTTAILVKDETHQVIIDIYNKLVGLQESFAEYVAAAMDTCSFNESTGFFNEHFAATIRTNWPILHRAPWFKAATEGVIFEDILYNTTDADTVGMVEKIKSTIQNISPETGTVTGIVNFKARLDAMVEAIEDIFVSYPKEEVIAGHIYGHKPYYSIDYTEASNRFESQIGDTSSRKSTDVKTTDDMASWTPDAGYDNYPMFPTETTYYTSTLDLREDAYESYDTDPADPWNSLFTQEGIDIGLLSISISAREVTYSILKDSGATAYGIDDFLEVFFDVITNRGCFDNAIDKHLDGGGDFVDNFGNEGKSAATNIVNLVKDYRDVAGAVHWYFTNSSSEGFVGIPTYAPFNQEMLTSPTLTAYLVGSDEVISDIRHMYDSATRKEGVFTGEIDLEFDPDGDGRLPGFGGDDGNPLDEEDERGGSGAEDDGPGDLVF